MRQYDLPRKRHQNGLMPRKLFFGLATFIVGTMVVLIALNQTNPSLKGKEAQDQISQLLDAVRKVYPGPSYSGVSATSLINRGFAPRTMVNGSNLVNTFDGVVTLAAVSVASGTDNAIVIAFPQVPRVECKLIITQLHSLFARVAANKISVKDEFSVSPSSFNSATTEKACDKERNLISFTTTS